MCACVCVCVDIGNSAAPPASPACDARLPALSCIHMNRCMYVCALALGCACVCVCVCVRVCVRVCVCSCLKVRNSAPPAGQPQGASTLPRFISS